MLGLATVFSAAGIAAHVLILESAVRTCTFIDPETEKTFNVCMIAPGGAGLRAAPVGGFSPELPVTFNARVHLAGRFDGALPRQKSPAKHSPGKFRALVKGASAGSKQGKYEQALEDLESAIESRPMSVPIADVVRAHVVKGIVLRRMGRTDKALDSYTDALRLNPNDPGALNSKAWLLFLLGRFDEALAAADLVIEAAPKFSAGRNTRAHILAALSKFDEAADDLRLSLGSGHGIVAASYRKALVDQGIMTSDSNPEDQNNFVAALMKCLKHPECILAEREARH